MSAAGPQSMETAAGSIDEAVEDRVVGERALGSINRARSLQSRVGNVLAVGLISALAVGFLAWYYLHTYQSRARVRQSAQVQSQNKAQGDMPLPPLGKVEGPRLASTAPSMLEQALGPPPEPPAEILPDYWVHPAEEPMPYGPEPLLEKTPEQLILERRLSGVAFSRAADSVPAGTATAAALDPSPSELPDREGRASGGTELDTLLQPRVTAAAQAMVLPTQRLLLPKGAFIDCTLETAIDSTLPGMTTCITATDTFGADGSTVLLERGTKLVGETRGQVQQGAARVFVLWNEARTPRGVVIPLASPGTDELGRAGVTGSVNRHFFERFGAAILISLIDGAVQGLVQSSSGGTIVFNPSTTENVMTEVLKSTVNIPPTISKANGDRIQVLVARDLDFRTVYELQAATHGP